MTEHGEEVVNDMEDRVVEVSLSGVDHVNSLIVEGFHPEGIDDECEEEDGQ